MRNFFKKTILLFILLNISFVAAASDDQEYTNRKSSLWFDGDNDVITVGKFEPLYENTIEAWVRPDSEKIGSIFANGGGPKASCGSGVHFEVSTKECCYDVNPNGCGTNNEICYHGNLGGRWVYLVGTYDGDSVKLYVDGQLENSIDNAVFDSSDWLTIGNLLFFNGHGHPYGGEILELRVWNYARTLEQIKEFRYKKLSGDEKGLVAHWVFDQGTGQKISNETTKKYSAVLGTTSRVEHSDPTWIQSKDIKDGQSNFDPQIDHISY